jgi:hypothetical protein
MAKDYEDSFNRKDGIAKSNKKGKHKPQAARQQKAKLKGTLMRLEKTSDSRKKDIKKKMGY